MSVLKTPDGRWYVQYQVDKTRKKEYFGHGDLNEARARAFQDALDDKKGRTDFPSLLTLDLCDKYQRDHLREASTAKMDVYKFAVLCANLGAIPAESLSTKHLSDYVNARAKQGIKRTTIKNEIARLKAAFSWAEDQDPPLIHRNRIHKFRMNKVGSRDVPLPPSTLEIQAILAHAAPHLFRAILLARYCGMRPGPRELFRITWQDVDWEGKQLKVHSAHKGGPESRMVPIAPALYTRLEEWQKADSDLLKAKSDLPIVHYQGKPIKSVKRAWATAKKEAGITREIRPYDLRHSFVTQALRSGADLHALSQIIGHSRPDTTVREYQHVTSEDHRRVVELTPDISGGIVGASPKKNHAQLSKNKKK